MTDDAVLDQIHTDVKDGIQKAVEFALEAPYPDARQVNLHVYAE
jgi:TPP-dependent pyruvate/acetoin dehydrogenase alpha subunit